MKNFTDFSNIVLTFIKLFNIMLNLTIFIMNFSFFFDHFIKAKIFNQNPILRKYVKDVKLA